MRFAIIGCGYVADYYMTALPGHPELELAGVMDRDPDRLAAFTSYYSLRSFQSLDEILEDPTISLLVNLTNPDSHYEISKAALEAGKHVYSEKPLAMDLGQARELVGLAEERGLQITSAPCNMLGESAQTAWKALRNDMLGKVLLVYAEMDDGLIHRTNCREWVSESGAPWPYEDEFEVGCTLEHAGYYVTWLVSFFGPAKSVTAFSSCLIPDKEGNGKTVCTTPDYSVACIEFDSGIVARLTCSIVAPPDRSLRIIGDEGVLWVDDCWDYGSPVRIQKRTPLLIRAEKKFPLLTKLLFARKIPLVRKPKHPSREQRMDFARGIAELAAALSEGRASRMHSRFALHVTEIVLAISQPEKHGVPLKLTTRFDPVEPMPWASS